MNNIAGIYGRVPTFLVFGVVPQIPSVLPYIPEKRERMNALHKARHEISKAISTFRIRTALSRNVPVASGNEIKIESQVLFYI